MRSRDLCHMRTTKAQISTFVVRCLDSMICILDISKVSRFSLPSVADQADLNVTWLKIPEDTFSHGVAHSNHVFYHIGSYSLSKALKKKKKKKKKKKNKNIKKISQCQACLIDLINLDLLYYLHAN